MDREIVDGRRLVVSTAIHDMIDFATISSGELRQAETKSSWTGERPFTNAVEQFNQSWHLVSIKKNIAQNLSDRLLQESGRFR